jgi:hypothetical protein
MRGCDATPLGATVTVTRPSQFAGGPGFNAVVSVEADADSFSIPVPRSADAPYTVTIVPDGGIQASRAAMVPVPPLRVELPVAEINGTKLFTLGGAGLPVISGALTSGDAGLVGYRVAAIGQWRETESPTEVSSVAITDATGAYTVTLSDGLIGTVELVARPPEGSVAPTVHVASIDARLSSEQPAIALPMDLGKPSELAVAVTGADLSGTISPVVGAVVTLSGAATNAATSFTISDQQLTNSLGIATLHVLDGEGFAGSYRLSIIPPATSLMPNSPLGVVFDEKVAISATSPSSLTRRLPPRLRLGGQVVDSSGKALSNATVTAQPSLRFLWTLDAGPQAFVASIPAATTVTPLSGGAFVLWLDASVAQVWGDYDLLIEPPATAQARSYLRTNVTIPRDSKLPALDFGTITVPDTAFVHGDIVDSEGKPVENAELKLYTLPPIPPALAPVCSEVAHAPMPCQTPAQLQGRNTSDAKGEIRLTLPRP